MENLVSAGVRSRPDSNFISSVSKVYFNIITSVAFVSSRTVIQRTLAYHFSLKFASVCSYKLLLCFPSFLFNQSNAVNYLCLVPHYSPLIYYSFSYSYVCQVPSSATLTKSTLLHSFYDVFQYYATSYSYVFQVPTLIQLISWTKPHHKIQNCTQSS
jgi:hypothetical protein